MTRKNLAGYGLAFLGTSITATLGLFVRNISPGNDFVIVLGRFSIGFLCLVVWLVLTKKIGDLRSIRVTWALVLSGVTLALLVVCYIKAILVGTLASASFLLYLAPLISSGLAAIWLKERFTLVSGLLLGIGALATLFITAFTIPDDPAQSTSLIYGFLSGLFYGLYLLLNNTKIMGDVSVSVKGFFQFLFASLVMIPFVAGSGINLKLSDIPWMLVIGVVHGFLALLLVIESLGRLKTNEYGTISYVEPVVATVIGSVVYNEQLTWLQWTGCALVLVTGIVRAFVKENTS